MSGFRISEEAEADLDGIWLYVARETGSVNIAHFLIDNITERFWFLGEHPYAGRRRDDIKPDLRSFPAGNYLIFYRAENDIAVIPHVVHGSRDIYALLRQ